MDMWRAYESRYGVPGASTSDVRRSVMMKHTKDRFRRKIVESLSYQEVMLGDKCISLSIINDSDNINDKVIYAMPDERLPHGEIVDWAGSKWLITEANALVDPVQSGKMRRCNYRLRWIDDEGMIISKWCVVEDGTKYLIGESDGDVIGVGDSRLSLVIGKDKDTAKLDRQKRFLIDDPDSNDVLAYRITKPNKLMQVYNGVGAYRFILREESQTDNDNPELRIADYYSWYPKAAAPVPDVQKTTKVFEEITQDAKDKREELPDDVNRTGVWL